MNRDKRLTAIIRGIMLSVPMKSDVDKVTHEAIRLINRLFKGKTGYWCAMSEAYFLRRCNIIEDCDGQTKDCNKKCRILMED